MRPAEARFATGRSVECCGEPAFWRRNVSEGEEIGLLAPAEPRARPQYRTRYTHIYGRR